MAPENLQEKNLSELRTMAQALGVKNVGKYRKNELIDMLSRSEAPAPKKRGRPAKAKASQQPAIAPGEQKIEAAQDKPEPAPKAPAKRRSEPKQKRKQGPAAEPDRKSVV